MGLGNKSIYYQNQLLEKGIITSKNKYMLTAAERKLFTKKTPGIVYDPKSKDIFKIGREKTDYNEKLRTNYETDPKKVTKKETYQHCWRNYWNNKICENRTRTVVDKDKIEKHRKMNEDNEKLNKENKQLNERNKKRNKAYVQAITTAKKTKSGDYTIYRDILRDLDADEKGLKTIESEFKNFYRDKKLKRWDPELGAKPEYGDFDPKYYGDTYKKVRDKYKEYEENDDIDVTERYGKENYYYWHYTKQGKAAGNRANKAHELSAVINYEEKTPEFAEGGWDKQTDTELAFIRDKQLGVSDNQTQRFLNVPEIKKLWEEAKEASEKGESNHFIDLGKEYFLDVNKAEEFAALFRLSQRPEDKSISFNAGLETGSDVGITDLEDAITTAIGEQGLVETQRFAALNQNILKDSIEELKKAKLKEQELEMMQGFGTFSEIFDINKTLTDSLLNDTGIGGYLPFAGGSSGFDAEKLEDQFKGLTGVRNEVVYNWQKWFDDSIKEKYQQDLDLGFSLDEVEDNIKIQKDFAESYITDYLQPRFDESRSMNEFVEYLDVRQEEKNPFQTQDLLDALKEVGQLNAETFLDKLKKDANDAGEGRGFNSNYYFNPTKQVIGGESVDYVKDNERYITQRDTVEADWEQARKKPDEKIAGLGYDTTWRAQAYRYGLDVNNKDQFARLHYQVKGKLKEFDFDGAEDIINYDKVKGYLYDKILPALEKEVEKTPTIFGNFIKPAEFADDMLEGLDPDNPESWNAALKELGMEDFKGSVDELKEFITSTLRTGSAEDIRRQIKFLNEKRKDPSQFLLGVEYIDREEDYNPINKLKGDTQLYKIFQDAGYEGTEDDFYENVFPDLDPSQQSLLSQAGSKDGIISLEGVGSDFNTDPFAAFAGLGQLTGGDTDAYGGTMGSRPADSDKSVADSFRIFSSDDDDDDYSVFKGYKKTKSGQELLSEYTKGFGSFF
tara:strand:- start:1825 stop:4695 length:2871 start_codon:yes stop_codon:yes gene_type:complete